MRMQAKGLIAPAAISIAATLLAGCGTSAPASAPGLKRVVGTDLIGVRGLTPADQHRIDRTVAGICAGGIFTRAECAAHGAALRKEKR